MQQQPDLLGMKDVTPKRPIIQKGDDPGPHPLDAKPKGGHQAKTKATAPSNPPSGGSSGRKSTAVAVAQPKAPAEAKSVLAIIADAASNPAVNPENMRALLDMQKEIVAEQRRIDFNDAFLLLQSELPVIRADRKIEIRAKSASGERDGKLQQSTPYATFPNIMKSIQPLLKKYNFSLWFATEPTPDGRLMVRGFIDGYGHQRSTAFPLPADASGSKNNQQGWGSAQSYGKRYCTIALLNIISEAVEDADTDGHRGNFKQAKGGFAEVPADEEKITAAQRDEIIRLMTAAKITEPQFCAKYGVKQIGFLPAELFDAAKKAIAEHAAAKGK